MAFFVERDNSRSEEIVQTSDEVDYADKLIPTKPHTSVLPNEILRKHVLLSWTGDALALMDNSAPQYDSFRDEEPQDKLNAEIPEMAYNFRYEKVEYAPTILRTEMCFGKGVAKLGNGLTYTGDMAYSHMHGSGVLEGPGFKYSGGFRNSEMEGDGMFEWESCKYSGEVKRGIRNGSGTLEFNDGTKYTGGFREGLREGMGKLEYPSGQVYEGLWKRGKKHGHGVLKYANGNVYDGSFKDDQRNGEGIMHWRTLLQKYTGHWKDGQPHGFGIHIWLDSKGSKQLRNRYVGEWQVGKRHGQGVFYYANGSKYEGQWEGNLKHGEGTMTFEDGSTYAGQFAKDHMVDRTLSGQPETTLPEVVSHPVLPQTTSTTNRRNPTRSSTTGRKPPPTTSTTAPLKRRVEKNPYADLLDISDLLQLENDPAKTEREVQKILLKHNSQIKEWYARYSEKAEAAQKEETFTMTASQLWRFLRDGEVTSYKVSLASINRLFFKGKKNLFQISNKIADAPLDSSVGKASRPFTPARGSGIFTPAMTIPSVLELSQINKVAENAEDADYLTDEEVFGETEPFDVHNSEQPVLFRQFAEAIVRVAYLKYARGQMLVLEDERLQAGNEEFYVERSKTQLGIALYKLLNERLVPLIGQHTARSAEEDMRMAEAQELLDKSVVGDVFTKYAWNNRSTLNGRLDQTIQVKGVVQLLVDSKALPGLIDRQGLLSLIEKYHDPEERVTEKELTGKSLLELFGSELTKYEFFEVLSTLAFVKAGDLTPHEALEEFISEYLGEVSDSNFIAVKGNHTEQSRPTEEHKSMASHTPVEEANSAAASQQGDQEEIVMLRGQQKLKSADWLWLGTDKQKAAELRKEAEAERLRINPIQQLLDDEALLAQITQAAFDAFDTEGSGAIDFTQIKAALAKVAEEAEVRVPSDVELDEVVTGLDTDKSGVVDIQLFRGLVIETLKSLL
jgi:hypothetical protein